MDALFHCHYWCVSENYKHYFIRSKAWTCLRFSFNIVVLAYESDTQLRSNISVEMIVEIFIIAFVIILLWIKGSNTLGRGECSVCGHRGHKPSVCYHRNRTCNVCLQVGHIASVCSTIIVGEDSRIKPSVFYFVITWILIVFQDNRRREYRCRACGQPDHTSQWCRYSNRRCNRCRVKGHISAACPGYFWVRKNRKYFFYCLVFFVVSWCMSLSSKYSLKTHDVQ